MTGRPTPLPGIYLVTDPGMSMVRIGEPGSADSTDRAWHHRAIDETVKLAVAAQQAGVATIQLRWKNVDAGYFLLLTREVSEALTAQSLDQVTLPTGQQNMQIIINDRVDVFCAAREEGLRVDGIHIGQTDLPPTHARALAGPAAQIGWSASTPTELKRARQMADSIDCLGVGVLRNTSTKTDAPDALGVSGIDEIAAAEHFPIIAIGGITASDIPAIAASHIHSAAVVSAIVAADNPGAAARELVELWNSAKETP
ncbi:MAG: thiamine phosphate synthase [Actinomycetaceae bacterium]|nr:thiamine phosphate synthase [Actinomycetaceae bacterium]